MIRNDVAWDLHRADFALSFWTRHERETLKPKSHKVHLAEIRKRYRPLKLSLALNCAASTAALNVCSQRVRYSGLVTDGFVTCGSNASQSAPFLLPALIATTRQSPRSSGIGGWACWGRVGFSFRDREWRSHWAGCSLRELHDSYAILVYDTPLDPHVLSLSAARLSACAGTLFKKSKTQMCVG